MLPPMEREGSGPETDSLGAGERSGSLPVQVTLQAGEPPLNRPKGGLKHFGTSVRQWLPG
jgi:hypothetical protein